MNRKYMILAGLAMTVTLYAQQHTFTRVDFDQIRSAVALENTAFYYPTLFERYRDADTTLSIEEFRYLYYGFTFQEQYRPYKKHDGETLVSELMMKDSLTPSDFSEIYRHCTEILPLHPFSTRYLLIMAIACAQLGNSEEARKYYFKYDRIISAILSSGDGATEQSAWSVILISDEYELINALGFQSTGQQKMLSKSLCDFIYVSDNDYGIDGFYFDVSRPFARGFERK